ncbi:unnamed protein product [Schistosoma mattheei]|uniref:Uncharacterized protein n=1 Tax=Schistosoma mattheei TaxID=31246 RepID=A0A183NUI4_9TREM|nr:unnamed protein product [Schistosoma mattheei]
MNRLPLLVSVIAPLIKPDLNNGPDDQVDSVGIKISAVLLNQKLNVPNLSREEIYLTKILNPCESEIKYRIRNSNEFKDIITTIRIEEDELTTSFDAFSLFTNVPISKVLDIVYNLLESNTELEQRCL